MKKCFFRYVVAFADQRDAVGDSARSVDAFNETGSARPRVLFALYCKKLQSRLGHAHTVRRLPGDGNRDIYQRTKAADKLANT